MTTLRPAFEPLTDDELAVVRDARLSTRPRVVLVTVGLVAALVAAQETDILLLDEPTTYLDLSHQIDVLDLLVDLNEGLGRTIVMVLHDLNHAARYADHLVAMREGRIVAEGDPLDIVTPELVDDILGMEARISPDPVTGTPMVVPIGRHGERRGAGNRHVTDAALGDRPDPA